MTAACRSCSGARACARNDRPEAVETVDIMPTLAAMLGLPIDASTIDGRCLASAAVGGLPRALGD